MVTFPSISTKTRVRVNAIFASTTILTWVRSTIVNINITMLVCVTRLTNTFVTLKKYFDINYKFNISVSI